MDELTYELDAAGLSDNQGEIEELVSEMQKLQLQFYFFDHLKRDPNRPYWRGVPETTGIGLARVVADPEWLEYYVREAEMEQRGRQ